MKMRAERIVLAGVLAVSSAAWGNVGLPVDLPAAQDIVFQEVQFRGNQGGVPQEVRDRLASPDEEWAVLEPRILAVMNAMGALGHTADGGRVRPRPPANSQVTSLTNELRIAVEESGNDALIRNKMQLLRDARERAALELQAARANLRTLLTIRQEAVMMEMGYLD